MLLHAKGDSMIGAGINDGDLIVATITNFADDGEIMVALINDSAMVKRLYRKNGYAILHAENPKYDDIEYNCALYAIKSKLDFNLPDFNSDVITDLSDENKLEFKNNLQKVRSVTMQLLSNFKTAIEIAIRGLDKQTQKETEETKEKQENESRVKASEERTTAKKTKAKSKKAESEME